MADRKGPAPAEKAGGAGRIGVRPHRTTTRPAPEDVDRLLSVADVCAALGCSRRWLEQARHAGRFPKPDAHVGRSPKWRRSTLEAWIARGGSR